MLRKMRRNDCLSISGKEQVLGGSYKEVRLSGYGSIQGALTAELLKVSGLGMFDEGVTVSQLEVSGQATFNHHLEVHEAKVSGLLTAKKNVSCQEKFVVSGKVKGESRMNIRELTISGLLTALQELEVGILKLSGKLSANSLKVENAEISGMVTITGELCAHVLEIRGMMTADSVESEVLKVKGRIDCKDMINSEKVEISSTSGSSFNEIGASDVKICELEPKHGLLSRLSTLCHLFSGTTVVKGNLIEADSVYVENARIKKIRGQDIVIGPHCEIEAIEYSGTLVVDSTSTVKQATMQEEKRCLI